MISEELEREFVYALFNTNPNDVSPDKKDIIEAVLKDLQEEINKM